MWSLAAEVVTVPLRTTRRSVLSSATTQRTRVVAPAPEPGVASGEGVTRVHSTTPSGSGSPDATPYWKTAPGSTARAAENAGPVSVLPTAVAAAAPAAPLRKVRRSTELSSGQGRERPV